MSEVTRKGRKIKVAVVELDQMKSEILTYEKPLAEVKASLDLDSKEKRIEELQMDMEAPGFWDDPDRSNLKMKELKNLKDVVEECHKLSTQYEDILTLIEMGYEENDEAMIPEIRAELDEFISEYEELRISTLLSGEYDKNNAILKLNAGAGGTESCDWCSMLYRMYTRWAERKGFTVEVLDFLDGDEAGIKSVTFQVNGINAYGYLKSEKGVHRLVRISPFNAQGKRQTSFVSLDVMPEIEEDLDVEIDDKDLRIDTYRSSGAGGQHINKTSSAIRITHIPTGTVVTCQNERSQFQNKDKAMQMLKAKLFLLKQEANVEKLSDIRGEVKEIGFGNQIRSYVLQPYKLVKDLRTDVETGNVDAVLDGALDPFMNGYLKWLSMGQPKSQSQDE
ncbi:MAG: peptide chain release factor 2 [Lachnospiraceae bacterium]|nr:peptide chain release factor 2 [Lachnospiraceae bacterium]